MSKVKTQPPLSQIATCLLFTAVLLATVPTSLQADVIPPIGLAPGSPYQLVFVTADTTAATSSDINYYNTFVQGEAALNPSLPTATWRAVASTVSVNARDNAPTYASVPIYNTNGQLVATGSTALWSDDLQNPVDYDQSGQLAASSYVWSGSNDSGTAGTLPLGELTPLNDLIFGPMVGLDVSAGPGWLGHHETWNYYSPPNTNTLPLYALSSPITVPAPEPSTFVLLGIGTTSLVAYAWRKRRRTA